MVDMHGSNDDNGGRENGSMLGEQIAWAEPRLLVESQLLLM